MSSLTELEKDLIRLLMVRNTLQVLFEIHDQSNHKLATSVIMRYVILELDNFIDYQSSMLGKLNDKQKKYVFCLSGFLEEINRNKTLVRKIRNGWIGHIQNKDNFKEDIMDLIKNSTLDGDQEIIIMGLCVISYVDALKIVLMEEFDNANERYNATRESSVHATILNNDTINQIIKQKTEFSKHKLRLIGFSSL
ncbi:MAG: hypothetical protein HY222_03140 [Thaumarchaeota archaeon]|nr:hypothetical protein [Nitrososphaerota archaeon]MBI3641370.1 hypothetical protein [Nitrososphaerota archaeon]